MERQTEKSSLEGSPEREGHLPGEDGSDAGNQQSDIRKKRSRIQLHHSGDRPDGRHSEDNNINIIGGEMLTRYEQETQIYFNEEEQDAEVYTASPVTYRRLMKLCQERPDDYQLTKTDRMDGEEVSWTFHLSSKKLVKFFKKREMSDEDREMARQRMMDNVHSIRIEPKTTKNEKEKES